jgi:hypothetical protein
VKEGKTKRKMKNKLRNFEEYLHAIQQLHFYKKPNNPAKYSKEKKKLLTVVLV